MLKLQDTVLVVIDIQGKLAHLMHDKEELFKNARLMIQGAQILEIPILLTEQYPQGLGPTIPEIAALLPDNEPISKMSFSSCREERFLQALKEQNRSQVLVAGIETHICVYQTTADLIDMGYEVQVVTDAVSSRVAENKQVGLQKMSTAGALMTSVETALFELLGVAGGDVFKEIVRIVK